MPRAYDWCLTPDDSRRVILGSGASSAAHSAGSTVGVQVPYSFAPSPPVGPSFADWWDNLWRKPPVEGPYGTWPQTPPRLSPVADVFHNHVLLNTPKEKSIYLAAPVNARTLPATLRHIAPTGAYEALNPEASAELARRTEKLQSNIERCAFARGRMIYPIDPMKAQPREGREFQQMFSISLGDVPSPYDGTNVLVGEFRVPAGMDGNLNRVVFDLPNVTGAVSGAGTFFFRVALNLPYVRNLGAVSFLYGSLTNSPFIIPGYGVKLVSGQYVRVFISVPAGSPIGGVTGRVNAGLFGYFWPRK